MFMNKQAVVWGAGGGLGSAIAKELLTRGWQVVAISNHPENHPEGTTLDLEIKSITDEFSLQQAVMETGYEIDQVALFVYAVGDIDMAQIGEMDARVWHRLLDANLTGAYLAVNHTLPLLTTDGTIIFLGAIHERLRLPGLSAYAAAKAGLEAFADVLRKEERQKKVVVIRPAAVDTPLWNKVPLKVPRDAAAAADAGAKIVDIALDQNNKGSKTMDLAG